MGRVLLIGASPLPGEGDARLQAPGLRSWQLAAALAKAGHPLRLLCLRDPLAAPDAAPPPEAEALGIELRHLQPARFFDGQTLESERRAFAPDLVVNAGSFEPARAAAQLAGDHPLWVDLPGDLLAEAQLRALRAGDDRWLGEYWERLRPCLSRGDRFSVICEPQKWALWGELLVWGRGSAANTGAELVHVIRPAVFPPSAGTVDPRGGPRSRGRVPKDAFVVCQSGGFNTWFDIETFAAGLSAAMFMDRRIHFVSAGGPIEGHEDRAAEQLREAFATAGVGDQCHFLGRIEGSELEALYAESDLAVLCDRPCLETQLGSRNRVLDWIRADLDVLATRGSELIDQLALRGAVIAIPPRDPEALTRALLDRASERAPERADARRRRAREHLQRHHDPDATVAPLVDYAAAPERAADHSGVGVAALPLEARRSEQLTRELALLRSELIGVYNSPTFRALGALHTRLKRLLQSAP